MFPLPQPPTWWDYRFAHPVSSVFKLPQDNLVFFLTVCGMLLWDGYSMRVSLASMLLPIILSITGKREREAGDVGRERKKGERVV